MIFVSNLEYVFVPGRLYFAMSEQPIPAMADGEWRGKWDEIPAPGYESYYYAFEVEKPWLASDAYAWFSFQLGARVDASGQVVNKPKFRLFDAEDDRQWIDGILAGKHAFEATVDFGQNIFVFVKGVAKGVGGMLKLGAFAAEWAPWILGGYLLYLAHKESRRG